jgi:hypothetical protein
LSWHVKKKKDTNKYKPENMKICNKISTCYNNMQPKMYPAELGSNAMNGSYAQDVGREPIHTCAVKRPMDTMM